MKTEKLNPYIFVVLLLLAVGPALLFPQIEWVYDDKAILQDHTAVRDKDFFAIWTEPYWGALLSTRQDPIYRPLFLSVVSVFNAHADFLRGWVLISHFLVGVLLYFFLRRHLNSAHQEAWALFGAACFLAHPATVETTAQVVGAMEIMPLGLGFAAFYFYSTHPLVSLVAISTTPGWKETGFIWLAMFAVFSFYKKEKKKTFFAVLFLVFWFSLRAYALRDVHSPLGRPINVLNPISFMNPWDANMTRLSLIGNYLRLFFFPFDLSSNYSEGTLAIPGYLIQVWTLLGLGGLWALYQFRKWFLADENIGVFTSLLTLIPCLHLFHPLLVIFAERFSYGLIFGLSIISSLVFAHVYSHLHPRGKIPVPVVLILGISCLFYLSSSRRSDWASMITLFSRDSQKYPQNSTLHYTLGVSYGAKADWENAKKEFLSAIQLRGDFVEAHRKLAKVYENLGDKEKASMHFKAVEALEK